MAATGPRRWKALAEFLLVAATGYSVYYLLTYILRRLENLDPDKPDRDELARKSSAVLRRLDQNELLNNPDPKDGSSSDSGDGKGRRWKQRADGPGKDKGRRERMRLTPYEQKIVTEVVAPEDIPVSFDDIGGLDGIIEELREAVIYPLTKPHWFSPEDGSGMGAESLVSSLLQAPKGVLLHGPPGCGKTMLAKALAKESGACFINLHISTLTEKWYGDSNKMVNAVFSLARKLQPSIIFIDEIDALLRSRSAQDHEASAMVKAEFMTHWDGLLTSKAGDVGGDARILVLGATNRIGDIDEAILRRLPKKFPVMLPDGKQRERILRLLLKGTKLDPSFGFQEVVERTRGFSGSDLKEACRDAAMVPYREMIRRMQEEEKTKKEKDRVRKEVGIDAEKASEEEEEEEEKRKKKREIRGLRNDDFFRKESGGKLYGHNGVGMGGQAGLEAAMAAVARAAAAGGAL